MKNQSKQEICVYRRIGFDMLLNEMTKMRVIFEPFVMLLIRKSLVPD